MLSLRHMQLVSPVGKARRARVAGASSYSITLTRTHEGTSGVGAMATSRLLPTCDLYGSGGYLRRLSNELPELLDGRNQAHAYP